MGSTPEQNPPSDQPPIMGSTPEQNPSSDQPGASSHDGQKLYSPSTHKVALAKFYRPVAGLNDIVTIDISIIHKFNWNNPHGDYLVPRVDAKGLITQEPAQVLKLAATRRELERDKNEPINKEKRTIFSKKRYTTLFDQILKRDGPIGHEDSEAASQTSSSEDEESTSNKTNKKKLVVNKVKSKASKNIRKKKVPQPKEISKEDMEILEFQAKEMPGLNLNAEDEDEVKSLKIQLLRTESERAELEAKLAHVVREKRIQDEVIERLALRIDALEDNQNQCNQQQHQPVRRQLNMDDAGSGAAPGTSRESGVFSERSPRTIYGARFVGKRRHKPTKNCLRKDLGNFTPGDYARFSSAETMRPGQVWVSKDLRTGEETEMRHLCFAESIENRRWQKFKNKDPPNFLRGCFRAMYSEEIAANRAVDINRALGQLNSDEQRKSLTPKKFACLKVMYERQVDKKIQKERRPAMKKKLNDILGQLINTAYQSQKQRQEEQSSSDLGSMLSQNDFSPDEDVPAPSRNERLDRLPRDDHSNARNEPRSTTSSPSKSMRQSSGRCHRRSSKEPGMYSDGYDFSAVRNVGCSTPRGRPSEHHRYSRTKARSRAGSVMSSPQLLPSTPSPRGNTASYSRSRVHHEPGKSIATPQSQTRRATIPDGEECSTFGESLRAKQAPVAPRQVDSPANRRVHDPATPSPRGSTSSYSRSRVHHEPGKSIAKPQSQSRRATIPDGEEYSTFGGVLRAKQAPVPPRQVDSPADRRVHEVDRLSCTGDRRRLYQEMPAYSARARDDAEGLPKIRSSLRELPPFCGSSRPAGVTVPSHTSNPRNVERPSVAKSPKFPGVSESNTDERGRGGATSTYSGRVFYNKSSFREHSRTVHGFPTPRAESTPRSQRSQASRLQPESGGRRDFQREGSTLSTRTPPPTKPNLLNRGDGATRPNLGSSLAPRARPQSPPPGSRSRSVLRCSSPILSKRKIGRVPPNLKESSFSRSPAYDKGKTQQSPSLLDPPRPKRRKQYILSSSSSTE